MNYQSQYRGRLLLWRIYRDRFVLSSLMQTASPSDLKVSQIKASMKRQEVIEDFRGSWEKEWFNYKPAEWGLSTHKVYDPVWKALANAKFVRRYRSTKQIGC